MTKLPLMVADDLAALTNLDVPVCRSAAPKSRHDGPDLRCDAAADGDDDDLMAPVELVSLARLEDQR